MDSSSLFKLPAAWDLRNQAFGSREFSREAVSSSRSALASWCSARLQDPEKSQGANNFGSKVLARSRAGRAPLQSPAMARVTPRLLHALADRGCIFTCFSYSLAAALYSAAWRLSEAEDSCGGGAGSAANTWPAQQADRKSVV